MNRKDHKPSHLDLLLLVLLLLSIIVSGCMGKLPDPNKKAQEQKALAEKKRKYPLFSSATKEIGPAEIAVISREKYTADPAWSPGGKKIAYTVVRINKQQGSLQPAMSIYVAGTAGEDAVLIAENAHLPVWSPDSKTLLFVSFSPDEPEKETIWSANADGSNKKQLTRELGSKPVLSPDGRKCAFLKREERSSSASLWVIDLKSSAEVKVASEVGWDKVSWFPDGQRLAFISEQEDPHQVAVVDVDGKGLTRLTRTLSVCSQPSVSPDGGKVLFIQVREEGYDRPDAGEVYAVDVKGGEPEVALAGQAWEKPEWSPDSRRFACGGRTVAVVEYENRDRIIIGSEIGSCWDPVWSPDGTKIIFYVPESEWGGKLYRLELKKAIESFPLYLLICGSYTASYPDAYNLLSAVQSQAAYLPPGFPKIDSSDLYADLTPGFSMVLGGRYTDLTQAENVSAQLKSAGFSPSIRKSSTFDVSDFLPRGAVIKKIVYRDLDQDKKSEVTIAFETTNGVEWQDYLVVLKREGESYRKVLEQGFQSASFDNYVNLLVRDVNKDGSTELYVHWIYDSVEKLYLYKGQAEGIFLLQEFTSDRGLTCTFPDGKLAIQTRNLTGRRGDKVLIEDWKWNTDRYEVVSSEVIEL